MNLEDRFIEEFKRFDNRASATLIGFVSGLWFAIGLLLLAGL